GCPGVFVGGNEVGICGDPVRIQCLIERGRRRQVGGPRSRAAVAEVERFEAETLTLSSASGSVPSSFCRRTRPSSATLADISCAASRASTAAGVEESTFKLNRLLTAPTKGAAANATTPTRTATIAHAVKRRGR